MDFRPNSTPRIRTMAPNTKNTDIKKAMSPQKKAWLAYQRPNFLELIKDQDECLEHSISLNSDNDQAPELKECVRLSQKFMRVKKAFWICSYNGDKEGCEKWYKKSKPAGLNYLECIEELGHDSRVVLVETEDGDEAGRQEGQDGAYLKIARDLKNNVELMEYILETMPN